MQELLCCSAVRRTHELARAGVKLDDYELEEDDDSTDMTLNLA